MDIYNDDLPIVYENDHPWIHTSEHSIISKTKLRKTAPSHLHYHNSFEIGRCVSGAGLCYINGSTVEYSAGDVQIILPYQPHYNVYNENESNTVWTFLTFDPNKLANANIKPSSEFLDELLDGGIRANGIFHPDEYPYLASLVRDMTELAFSNEKYNSDLLNLKEIELLILLYKLSKSKDYELNLVNIGAVETITPAVKLVSKNSKRGILTTVHEMAAICNMSESHFRKIFTESTGYSPKNYIDRSIATIAADKLAITSVPIGEVARSLGFDELSTFYRIFTKSYGMSPSKYRESLNATRKRSK